MAQSTHVTDGAAYERFMGRWNRAAGNVFLDWIAAPAGARWVDVGCGTGVFAELVLERCSPAAVQRADFRAGDAQSLPFAAGEFDVVASALAIDCIADRSRAIAEMRRVGRPGALVVGYVWDFADGGHPDVPIQKGLKRIGVTPPAVVGTEETRLKSLAAMFAAAGLKDIATRKMNISLTYPDFDDFWVAQPPAYSPYGKAIAELSEGDRAKLKDTVRDSLRPGPGGIITRMACANAIRARVP
jgi:SAM-dependent methyltransferase